MQNVLAVENGFAVWHRNYIVIYSSRGLPEKFTLGRKRFTYVYIEYKLYMIISRSLYIEEAIYLSFVFQGFSDNSYNLNFTLSEYIKPGLERLRKLSPQFLQCLDSTIASLLKVASASPGAFLYRSMTPRAFNDDGMGAIPVRYRAFKAITDGLEREGFLEVVKGFIDPTKLTTSKGLATRFRATTKLIDLAASYGILLSEWASHFAMIPRPKAVARPIQLRAKKNSKFKSDGLPVDLTNDEVRAFAKQVQDINGFMAGQDIQPCEWHFGFSRIFANGDDPDFAWNKGARLYSYAFGKGYQQVPKEDRRLLTINSEPTVEVDISASYLTIFHELMGVPPPADPYDVPGLPRSIVKIWVTITLGHTGFHRGWPLAAKRRYTKASEIGPVDLQRAYPFRHVQDAVLAHLPVLKDWPKNPITWADLQFRESSAIVDSVHRLAMVHGVAALPLHDALIVPKSKAALAEKILSDCFHHHVGVRPSIKVKGA